MSQGGKKVPFRDLTHRRTPIDDRPNRGAVALAIGSHTEECTKRRHDDRREIGTMLAQALVAGLMNGDQAEK